MSLQRNFRVGGVSTTAVVLLLALVPVGMCQTASVQKEEPAPSDTIDEITVYGDKSLRKLHRELYKAEDAVIDLFNSLNSDDEFDIHCYKEAPTGSHIKKRVCKTNYFRDLIGAETRQSLLTEMPYIHPVAKIKQKDELLRKEMEALMVERPELANAISKAADAKQAYESERQKRCEGRVFICRK